MKNKIVYSKGFAKDTSKLPLTVQTKLSKLILRVGLDPYHPILHTKPLMGKLSGSYSFRITRDYRVIFRFVETKTIELVTVLHRKDVYR